METPRKSRTANPNDQLYTVPKRDSFVRPRFERTEVFQVPENVRALFEQRRHRYDNDHSMGDLEEYLLVKDGRFATYFASHGSAETVRVTHLIDCVEAATVGLGAIYKLNDDERVGGPFPAFTETFDEDTSDENYKGRGLGSRRLILMNAYTQMRYHEPLVSSPAISSDGEMPWRRLVAAGLAEEVMIPADSMEVRYRFISL